MFCKCDLFRMQAKGRAIGNARGQYGAQRWPAVTGRGRWQRRPAFKHDSFSSQQRCSQTTFPPRVGLGRPARISSVHHSGPHEPHHGWACRLAAECAAHRRPVPNGLGRSGADFRRVFTRTPVGAPVSAKFTAGRAGCRPDRFRPEGLSLCQQCHAGLCAHDAGLYGPLCRWLASALSLGMRSPVNAPCRIVGALAFRNCLRSALASSGGHCHQASYGVSLATKANRQHWSPPNVFYIECANISLSPDSDRPLGEVRFREGHTTSPASGLSRPN